MYKNLKYPLLLLLTISFLGCNSGTNEDKSISSTHPKLEKQLARDTANLAMRNEENADLYQRYRITTEEYEKSGNYNVPNMYRGKLASVDESSHTDARTFKTALREGLAKGVNFAGKYTVVTVGCGTACQQHFIVDRESGKIVEKIQGSAGARYNANSRVFILNPPDSTINYRDCRNCTPQAYAMENGKLKRIEKK
ncbi:hypothetical protein H8S95_12290 [Pontibacter sp. KCTC 32443]|uniref:hypothetical protein n=1 Tax=Pontibacter TaxID=323449 RepID=UPI00164DA8FA|nr:MULTISPECIES: hypothetical protein [Pontibacter]MBC5774847.1 hypothetical protein [Pontibacter sp. KCTC 32443]